ncbi:noc3l [Scenedesmus sp. PABB004]|nr:noc3l [Scenedesmus sp. PABB004]
MGNKRKHAPGSGGAGAGGGGKRKQFSRPGKPPTGGGAALLSQGGGKHGGSGGKQAQDVPLPDASGDEEAELDVGEEDVAFVQQYGSSLGFLRDLDAAQLDKAVKAKQQQAAAAAAAADGGDGDDGGGSEEEGAADYERRPRAVEKEAKAASRGLPVKTPDGEVVFQRAGGPAAPRPLPAVKLSVEGVEIQDTVALEKAAARAAAKEAAAAAAAERRAGAAARAAAAAAAAEADGTKQQQGDGGVPPALAGLLSLQDTAARREALKQQMALAAQHLLSAPEKHVTPGLRLLLTCAADRDGHVSRLGLLSLLGVFRDLLPGYRIRSLSEQEQETRVSKEVAALRDYEQALLKGYQTYLKSLLAAATPRPAAPGAAPSGGALATQRVAVRCMGQLLVARPGFNYSSDLLQALVPLLPGPDPQVAEAACGALRELLVEDAQGKTALEAVQLVADLVRKRKCVLPPAVVDALLVLRFEAVTPTAQGGAGAGAGRGKLVRARGPRRAHARAAAAGAPTAEAPPHPPRPPRRVPWAQAGKKAARRAKRKSELDKDFDEAQAAPDAAELAALQSQMLEALFEVFFRVLKHCAAATAAHAARGAAPPGAAAPPPPGAAAAAAEPTGGAAALSPPWPAAKVARRFPLLAPSLVGLGRYSHLISVDYFNDLMAVLQELLAAGALPARERLGVLLAALDTLKGQGEALAIDRRAFYNQLYHTLLLAPLGVLFEPHEGGGQQQQAGGGGGGGGGGSGGGGDDGDDAEDAAALAAARVGALGWEALDGERRDVVPTSVLLLRALEQQLLGVKQADMGRLAAFAKRLAGLLLSGGPAEALGAATLLWRLMKRNARLLGLLEWEGGAPVGGQQFQPDVSDPSEAGALAAALWELPLAAAHYHPHVAAAARALLALTPGLAGAGADGGAGGAVVGGAAGPQEVAAAYEVARRGGFRPAPTPPGRGGGRAGGGVPAGSSRAGMAARQAAAAAPWTAELADAVAAEAVGGAGQQAQAQPPARRQGGKQAAAAAAAAAATAAAAAAADDVDLTAVAAAAAQQFVLSRAHARNRALRRQAAVARRRVELMRERLIARQAALAGKQQRQQQQRGACRFEMPKASLACNAHGYAAYGLSEKPGRRIMGHSFEQQKAALNETIMDRQAEKPSGQRFAASAEWRDHHVQLRWEQEAEEERKRVQHEQASLAGVSRQLPVYQTSTDNPLARAATTPAGGLAYDAGAAAPPGWSLSAGNTPRPDSQRARGLDGQLGADMLPAGPEQLAEEAGVAALAAAVLARRQAEEEREEALGELLEQWPHGMPKRLQLELFQQQGLVLPALGYGSYTSTPYRDIAHL